MLIRLSDDLWLRRDDIVSVLHSAAEKETVIELRNGESWSIPDITKRGTSQLVARINSISGSDD